MAHILLTLRTESAPLKAAGITMDLVDSVELENLSNIYLWKYPELNITILRPCNIVGPGVNNTLSQLLMQKRVPALMGYSPMMQFIHLEDMADAIVVAFDKNHAGIYNVAPDDCVPYQVAVKHCGCKILPIPSIPENMPLWLAKISQKDLLPPHLLDYFKYAATINGSFSKMVGVSTTTTIIMGGMRITVLKWKLSGHKSDLIKDGNKVLNGILKMVETNH